MKIGVTENIHKCLKDISKILSAITFLFLNKIVHVLAQKKIELSYVKFRLKEKKCYSR